jgi:putative spermidine/putrescine transport system ATP-binding protein
LTLPSSAPTGTGVLSVALRPEKIGLSPAGDAGRATDACAHGVIESTNFLGGAVLYRIALESGHHILAQQPNAGAVRLFAPGNTVMLDWEPADLVVLKD